MNLDLQCCTSKLISSANPAQLSGRKSIQSSEDSRYQRPEMLHPICVRPKENDANVELRQRLLVWKIGINGDERVVLGARTP